MYKTALALIGVSLIVTLASAQSVPSLINYQGRLTDQAGAPLAVGSYGIQFRLWDSPSATTTTNLIWAQQQNVAIQANGVFNVTLGAAGGSAIPGAGTNDLASAFGSSNRFLGVTIVSSNGVSVPSPSEILPRQQLLSVPFALEAQTAAALISNLANALCPPGSIMAYMGTNPPGGWLLCDGIAVSRTQYAALLTVIGTSSGAGDGVTTFNLPDLRGMFLRGVDNGAGNDPEGVSRGPRPGSIQFDALQRHNHKVYMTAPGNGGDVSTSRTVPQPGSPDVWSNPFLRNDTATDLYAAEELAGARTASETRPKNVYVNYIIKY